MPGDMSVFIGKWKLDRSENFEEYLKQMGVNLPMRKAASMMTPTCEIDSHGEEFTIKMNVPVITLHVQRFMMGKPFDDMLPDGTKQGTLVIQEGNTLIFREVEKSDPPHLITREVRGDEMVMTCVKGDTNCRRIFKRIKNS